MTIAKHDIKRILVDNESSINVLFYDAFIRMGLLSSQLKQISIPLICFFGDLVEVEGEIILPITATITSQQSTIFITLMIVRYRLLIISYSNDQG